MSDDFKRLFKELDNAILDCFWVPNESLPESHHDDREGGRTLSSLNGGEDHAN